MSGLESLGKVVSTDILVVGGGIGGLAAAISAKEESPGVDVVVVEKNVSGWAGQANKGGGIISYVPPETAPEEVVEYHAQHIGDFLEDQELLLSFLGETVKTLDRMESWGPKLFRHEDGSFRSLKFFPYLPWSLTAVDLDFLQLERRYAQKLGVRFIDKVTIVDLLKDGDRVAGGIGFSLLDGACHIVRAKATIIATGGQSFRVLGMFSCQRGDGAAAAYRAGADIRNAEFAPMFQFAHVKSKDTILGAEDCLYNAKEEPISPAFRTEYDSDIGAGAACSWYKEMRAGRGPIYTRHSENYLINNYRPAMRAPELWPRPVTAKFWSRIGARDKAVDGDAPIEEVRPIPSFELGALRVDHGMATTVPGLFAVGNVSYTGSSMIGAVPPPGRMRGSGIMHATWMGMRSGPAAVKYVSESTEVEVNASQAEELAEGIFRPLKRTNGIHPLELIPEIQAAVCPVGYSLYKSKERMERALAMIEEVEAKIPKLSASDSHHLSACNEVRSMVLCAQYFYRASLERKESRGWHIREDYPDRDDKNWLKWISLKDKNGEMVSSTEDVPIGRYPIKP